MRFFNHNTRVMGLAIGSMILLGLTGCIRFGQDAPPPAILSTPPIIVEKPAPKALDTKPICGKVRVFTDAQMKALADAVGALDETSPIIGAMGDYQRMRAEARACLNFK